MTEPILDVRNLHKSFGGLAVSRNVNLTLQPNEIHALIGPNGAGKSTLINQIVGDLRPNSGTIWLRGRDLTALATHDRVRAGLARSFQVSSLLTDFSVLDNLRLAVLGRNLPALGWWKAAASDVEVTRRSMEVLAVVGLETRTDDLVSTLSYGERRHLELGMALALKPDVLLLDEPMAGVGPQEGEGLTKLLDSLRDGCSILLVEHDMDVVFSLADRISVLVEGSVLATGAPEKIRNMEEVQEAYFGSEDVW